MIPRPVKDIDRAALQSLIHDAVPEGKTIEYQVDMPGKAESDRDRLLATVASLANTAGGDILIGVEADKGIPIRLRGIEIEDLDKETLRIEHMVLNGIAPRLPALDIHAVKMSKGNIVLVIRVRQSWIAPHRVNRNSKFYGRNSRGRYELDVDELRTAFTMSEGIANRIREFRTQRIGRIQDERTPIPLRSRSLMVLHVLPRAAFSTRTAIDMATLEAPTNHVAPLGATGWNHRVNLDGFLTFVMHHARSGIAYTQLFRSGAMESAMSLKLDRGAAYLPSVAYERAVIHALQRYMEVADNFGLEPPYYGFLSLLGMMGAKMGMPPGVLLHVEEFRHAVNDDTLMLPEVVIEERAVDAAKVLRPVFDTVWNAFGFSRLFNYDEQGNRSAHR